MVMAKVGLIRLNPEKRHILELGLHFLKQSMCCSYSCHYRTVNIKCCYIVCRNPNHLGNDLMYLNEQKQELFMQLHSIKMASVCMMP